MRNRLTSSLALLAVASQLAPIRAAAQLAPERLRALVAERAPAALETFREYLGFPNDGHHPEDIERLAVWLERAFRDRGFTVERLANPGNPLLFAERRVAKPAATVLVYLQADGQPVDPTAWFQESPYRPVLKTANPSAPGGFGPVAWPAGSVGIDPEARIFARSASDSKAPNVQFLVALDLLAAAGVAPDYDIKVIVDTMEEMGSPHLPAAVVTHAGKLAADMLIIFDGPPHGSGRPSLKFGARGIATFTLTTYGPRVAQHSGHYGNYAPNPAQRLAEILATLKDDDGRVPIAGFYDGVSLDAEARRILDAVPDDEAAIRRELGIAAPDRVGGSLQEAIQYPSLNVRGMRSAWVGDESRTIVPSTAVAEVDVRLVRETDGQRLLDLVHAHVAGLGYHVVSGRDPTEEERAVHAKLARFDGRVSYAAFRTDFDSTPGRWLVAAFERLYGEKPVMIRTSGGSIPISPFVTTLGIPAVTVPTVNPDNNQHSPNENIRVGSFVEGIAIAAAVLGQPLAPFVTAR
jgi:acetylornithine deacetylase/succinyl-diaminopimelate desuccinylase-like protein